MGTFTAISAASRTIERLLTAGLAVDEPVVDKITTAVLVRSDDFDTGNVASVLVQRPRLSVFLYRVEINATMRPGWSAVGVHDGRAHLPLDLHYLLTPWSDNAEEEHRILGSALATLDATPIAQGPLLAPDDGWTMGDAIQLTVEDLTGDTLTRTFESLQSDFRLSMSLLARILRIDGPERGAEPVTTAATGLRVRGGEEVRR